MRLAEFWNGCACVLMYRCARGRTYWGEFAGDGNFWKKSEKGRIGVTVDLGNFVGETGTSRRNCAGGV